MPYPRISVFRSSAAAVLLAAAAALLAPAATDPPKITSLTGQLLIAAPTIGDPRFAHTVILMVRHDKEGAFGIVINRPIEERAIASLLEAPGEDVSGISGRVRIFEGGPVQPEHGLVVHSDE